MLSPACQQNREPKPLNRAEKRRLLIDSLSHFAALPLNVNDPEDNPATPEKVALGRLLFYDPILSGNRDVACATCHHPSSGYAESRDIAIGVNGHGFGSKRAFRSPNDIPFTKRNSQTILNTAFNGIRPNGHYQPETAPMFWDIRAQSLEHQALEPLKALEEMRGRNYTEAEILPEIVRRLEGIPVYQQLFSEAFGETSINPQRIAMAIAAFERTLLTNHSRFDRYMRGEKDAISISERDGFKLFIRAGCGNCHNGPMFTDYQFHVIGAPENAKLGFIDAGIDSTHAFRTPSLRNLRFTSPYMHNGSFHSLKRVLEFYEDLSFGKMSNPHLRADQLDPLIREIELKVIDMNAIISFLNTLNDHSFDKQEPPTVPSGLPVGGNIQ